MSTLPYSEDYPLRFVVVAKQPYGHGRFAIARFWSEGDAERYIEVTKKRGALWTLELVELPLVVNS